MKGLFMNVIVNNIKLPLGHKENEVFEAALKKAAKCLIKGKNPQIYRKSIDARRNKICCVYSVLIDVDFLPENFVSGPEIRSYEEKGYDLRPLSMERRPIVIGSGPCGLFAAYVLAKAGFNPIVAERGEPVEKRICSVESFIKTGVLNENSNIQFGEGGAGTFSDGKLNTRIGDPLERFILKVFVENGASEDILTEAKPHIGTDVLRRVVKNLRENIKSAGGEFMFSSLVTDIITENGSVCAAEINGEKIVECSAVLLATGHSSRDTYEMLLEKGFLIQPKPFAVGVRIEHKQSFISRAQYGDNYKKLPPADYRLAYNGEERSCYSFCMCPGGTVVNASSEKGRLTVNGMSNKKRDAENANSALVVSVRPDDFKSNSPLAGIEFQRKYEELAYKAAEGAAPVQLAKDFIKNKVSTGFEEVYPSFGGKTVFYDLRECLPDFVCKTLKEGLLCFENKISGFSSCGSVMTGVEMRTSAPVRILRDENYQAVGIKGLFPAGEGAGYAGGIMSAAIDGVKTAQKMREYFETLI